MMIMILIPGTIPTRRVCMAERRPQERGVSRRPKILDYIGAGGMDEEQARHHAYEVVRRAREEGSRMPEGPAPSPDEVRERREVQQQSRHS
jgi:hypothetical protein